MSNQKPEETNSSIKKSNNVGQFIMRIVQGAVIGLGAVLPGVSGGVLCVVFGVYKPIMEVLSNPFKAIKKHIGLLIPIGLGIGVGFLGISKILGILLNKYPDPSVCFFVGLICGMLPSLFKEAGEKGRTKGSYASLGIAFAVCLALLVGLNFSGHSNIEPNIGWYLFCGCCIALSVIVPGMSFSTLLMPLGLYTPLVDGIGNLDFKIILPAGAGALITVILLANAVNKLMDKHYSIVFHGIIGIVIAATAVIIPFESFTAGVSSALINVACIASGIIIALVLDKINSKVAVPEK